MFRSKQLVSPHLQRWRDQASSKGAEEGDRRKQRDARDSTEQRVSRREKERARACERVSARARVSEPPCLSRTSLHP
jgi:hypothetical protein